MRGLNRKLGFEESRAAISIFLILIIAFIAFFPSLENGFINLDDALYVTGNKMITDLSLEGIKNIFTSFHNGLYKPLTFLSYAIEYHFVKLNPFTYHATNLVLHLFNCALVFWMVSLISGNLGVPFIAALLFAAHPLHVESVAWITERKDMLYSFFFLGAAILYLYYRKSKSNKCYFFSLIAFFLSLLVKPMGTTLPFVLLLFDFLQKRRCDRNTLNDKIPFFILSILILIINMAALRLPNNRGAMPAGPVSWDSFLIAAHGIVFYLKQLFLPIKLSFLYPYPEKINGLLPPVFLFSPAMVVFLMITILSVSKYSRKFTFGSLFFLITVLPVLQLIPLSPAIAADRYTYIPSIGVFYLVGECFYRFYNNKCKYEIFLKAVLVAMLIIITAALSFLTYSRTKVWKNSIILWSDALKAYPNNPIAYANRGGAYAETGKFEQAISDCNKAIALNPNEVNVYAFRAGAYISTGKFEQAISDCNKAIELNPQFARAYYNRAVAHFFMVQESIKYFPIPPRKSPKVIAGGNFLENEYIKSWDDLRRARSLGYEVSADFLQALEEASGKQEKYLQKN